ncbi:MAG: hypothetical protein R3Y53_08315 [Bacillota bacterium]
MKDFLKQSWGFFVIVICLVVGMELLESYTLKKGYEIPLTDAFLGTYVCTTDPTLTILIHNEENTSNGETTMQSPSRTLQQVGTFSKKDDVTYEIEFDHTPVQEVFLEGQEFDIELHMGVVRMKKIFETCLGIQHGVSRP